MVEWGRVCCGTDFSEPARIAMLKAAELARRLDCELELVHVHTPPPVAPDVLATPSDVGALAREEMERKMEMWRSEAARIVGHAVSSIVLVGDPASEIVRLARERATDLIVLGTHGRTGLRRLVLGSVAERVVREARCAVLVVRRRDAARGETEEERNRR